MMTTTIRDFAVQHNLRYSTVVYRIGKMFPQPPVVRRDREKPGGHGTPIYYACDLLPIVAYEAAKKGRKNDDDDSGVPFIDMSSRDFYAQKEASYASQLMRSVSRVYQ